MEKATKISSFAESFLIAMKCISRYSGDVLCNQLLESLTKSMPGTDYTRSSMGARNAFLNLFLLETCRNGNPSS